MSPSADRQARLVKILPKLHETSTSALTRQPEW
jgi:hypothetical protein